MKMLPKGGNAPLASRGIVRLELRWEEHRGALDAVCFAVDESGRVPEDDWFVFYNQPQAPGDVIRITSAEPGRAGFLLRLDGLPARIQRCVLAATLERGQFRDLTGTVLMATAEDGETLGFTLSEAADEQALILAEIYRHGTGWKFRAIGQGFRGGLQPLAEHFGVTVGEAPAHAPTPEWQHPWDRLEDDIPARSRRFPVKSLMALILLASGAGALWHFNPALFKDPGALWRDSQRLIERLPTVYQPPSCAWTDDQVFERYHALGKSYVTILKRVEEANRRLSGMRRELGKADSECPASFGEQSQREIEQLEQLPVGDWMEEATQLNACAGLLIKRVESELGQESRPLIIQRLVHEADRARNLESDLTNISRDLAYQRNKTGRLIDGFKEILEACPR
ncbi:TerD family protein [Thiocystis violacea]|uniref:TerD family protein n=1 Tax=Thiocystis violacea TaxID=13725 RepID=UPI001906CD10|nr:TerD family protein [Thiocystis violacea]MBK1719436.1 stress protein [Thiocystis violacea]